jgi:uncharacterized membrane protein YfcA
MTPTMIAAVVVGTCLGGFVQGVSGFAFGLVAVSVWAWSIEPQLAGPLVVWGSWVGQVLSIGTARRGFAWRRTVPFLVGGVAGVPLGTWLLPYIDMHVFRAGVGTLLVVYCSIMLCARSLPVLTHGGRWLDGTVGAVGGVMGGLAGLTGPAPTLWCLLRGWDRDAQRAMFQAFNLAMHSLTLTIYLLNGTVTAAMLPAFALIVPIAIIPTLAGVRVYRRFSHHDFQRLVLFLLLAAGLMMLLSLVLHPDPIPSQR